jgi:DNA-binding NarL/FixJ family response regulator
MDKPSIIIVDDHQIFRKGVISLLVNENIANVIGEASNGKEFLSILKEENLPDLVLIDIEMPIMDGEEATRIALDKYPNLKIVALSMFGDEGNYSRMVNAGVKGFLLKNSDLTELESAITTVSSGETYFSNELLRKIISKLSTPKPIQKSNDVHVSARELEVLALICGGMTNEEISEKLCISASTVKGHRTNLLEKTGCKNTASLIMFSIKNKMIEL